MQEKERALTEGLREVAQGDAPPIIEPSSLLSPVAGLPASRR